MLRTWRRALGSLVVVAFVVPAQLLGQTGTLHPALRTPQSIGLAPASLRDRGVVRIRAVELQPGLFDRAAAKQLAQDSRSGGALRTEMNFFDGASFRVTWTGVDQTDDRGALVWTGSVEGMKYSHAVLVISDSLVSANIATGDGRLFQIRSTDDGGRWAREIDQRQFSDGALPLTPSAGGTQASPPSHAIADPEADPLPDDGSVIDVMVVYTPTVTMKSGGANAAQQLVQLGIAETNLGYQNSGVIQRVRLVYSGEVQYTESGSMNTDLNRLTAPDDGYIDVVHRLRDNYNADLVSLWVDSSEYCGLAWLLSNPSVPRPERAFSVVHYTCATGNYSFGHEMGHNMGANHAREDSTGPGAYPYSFGYKQPDGSNPFRTIMAYACLTTDCARVNYWSNPSVNVNGQPAGVASSASNSADNHLTLNNTRNVVANYRTAAGGGANGFPESDHPYANNTDKTYTYTLPGGAPALSVTFDARTAVENGYDFIYISDANGNQISGSPFTGSTLANRTVTVPGANVKIRLISDGSMTDYGFKITSVTATGGGGLPKLVVSSLTAPTKGTIGTSLSGVQVGIANQSSAAAGTFRLGFYYSRNRNVSTTDIFSGSSCTYASLAANGTASCNGPVGVPSTLAPGTWYLAAIADDQNKVAQSDRSGNMRVSDSGTLTIDGGTPAELIQPVPGSVLASSSANFQWSAGNGVSGYSLAIGTTTGGTDIYNRDQGTALSVTIGGLPTNGASLYIRLTSRIGSGTVSREYVLAAARLGQGGNLPKLVITAFTAPTTASVGVNLPNVSVAIANQGSADTGVFRIGFYYSRNQNVTTSDVFSGWYCNYPEGLRAGSSNVCSGEIGVPTTLASGTWYLAAIADDQGKVQQSDASGNTRDNDNGPLSVTGISPATMLSPQPGSTLTSSTVIFRWDGGSGADQYYLNIGTSIGADDIFRTDLGLSLSTAVPGLPTDGRTLYVRLWTRFGDSWSIRDYIYRAFRAGAGGSAPQIVVTSFTAPIMGTVGVNLQGTRVVIANQGNANAGPFRLGYYYGKNRNVTTGDVFSGWFCAVDNGLAVGSTFTCTGDVGVPAALSAGQWYLAVIADDLNQLTQTDRSGGVRAADSGPLIIQDGSGGPGGSLPESSHPYANNTDRSWSYTAPGSPAAIKVAFDGLTSVENGWDYIYIYDGAGNQIPFSPFTGTDLQNRTVVVPRDTVRIRLVSDVSNTDYGFKVTSIVDAGTLPRLVITAFSAPTTGSPGVNLQRIQITVANQGPASAGPFNIGFYYGKSSNVTPNDVSSGWSCPVDNGLAAGATFVCGGEIGVPALSPGTWYVAAIADDFYAVDQSDRRGNVRVSDNGPIVISASDVAKDVAIHSDSGTNISGTTRKRPDRR